MEGSIVRRVVECVEVYESGVGEWLFMVQAWKEVFKPERVVCKGEMEIEMGCVPSQMPNKQQTANHFLQR